MAAALASPARGLYRGSLLYYICNKMHRRLFSGSAFDDWMAFDDATFVINYLILCLL